MIVPVWQTCPKCRGQFKGSDMVGDPCPSCQGLSIDNIDMEAISVFINQVQYEEEDNDRSK